MGIFTYPHVCTWLCVLGEDVLIADFYAIGILSLTRHRPSGDDFPQGEFHSAAPVSLLKIFSSLCSSIRHSLTSWMAHNSGNQGTWDVYTFRSATSLGKSLNLSGPQIPYL